MCIFCKHFESLDTINSLYKVTCLPLKPTELIAHTFQVPINWLACHSNVRVLPVKLMKYQVNIQTSHISRCVTRNLSGSQCNLREKEARRIHESLKSAKADTFATLVLRSMPHGRRAPLHDGKRVRERTARVVVGDHDGLSVLVQRVIKRLSTS